MSPPAKKSLGQHFLVSRPVVGRILETVRFAASQAQGIVEIGPGRGALTAGLAELGKPMWAVEKDGTLAAGIAGRFPAVQVTQTDARSFDWCGLWRRTGLLPWLAVGNLPYNAGTEILWQCLMRRDTFCAIVVMLQREVAHKFCARADEDGYGPYAAWADPWWERRLLFTVPPGAFRPAPAVTSAVCAFLPRSGPPLTASAMPPYWDFLQGAFRYRRKTVLGNLAGDQASKAVWSRRLASLKIPPLARAGQVAPAALLELYRTTLFGEE